MTEAVGQRKFIFPDANLVSLDLFAALPQRQLEGGNVYRNANVRLAWLQRRLLNSTAGDAVGTR